MKTKILITTILIFCFSVLWGQKKQPVSSGWQTVYSGPNGQIQMNVIINDPYAIKNKWTTGIYFKTNISQYVQISMAAKEWTASFNKTFINDHVMGASAVFLKGGNGWREKMDVSGVIAYTGMYINYLKIGQDVIYQNGQRVGNETNPQANNSSNSNNPKGNNQNNTTTLTSDLNSLISTLNAKCKELEKVAFNQGGSQVIANNCGKTYQPTSESISIIKSDIIKVEAEIHRLSYSNNNYQSQQEEAQRQQEEMQRRQQEEQNRINQINNQRRQYVNVYNEGVDLGNSGKHSEAAAKYQEAIGLATNESERRQAQDAYNRASKSSKTIETVAKVGEIYSAANDIFNSILENSEKKLNKELDKIKIEQEKRDAIQKDITINRDYYMDVISYKNSEMDSYCDFFLDKFAQKGYDIRLINTGVFKLAKGLGYQKEAQFQLKNKTNSVNLTIIFSFNDFEGLKRYCYVDGKPEKDITEILNSTIDWNSREINVSPEFIIDKAQNISFDNTNYLGTSLEFSKNDRINLLLSNIGKRKEVLFRMFGFYCYNKDITQAKYWLEKISNKDDISNAEKSDAYLEMAQTFGYLALYIDMNDEELKQNDMELEKYAKIAAELGNICAYELLGSHSINWKKKEEYYLKGAELNNKSCINKLIGLYEHLYKDKKQARLWRKKQELASDNCYVENIDTIQSMGIINSYISKTIQNTDNSTNNSNNTDSLNSKKIIKNPAYYNLAGRDGYQEFIYELNPLITGKYENNVQCTIGFTITGEGTLTNVTTEGSNERFNNEIKQAIISNTTKWNISRIINGKPVERSAKILIVYNSVSGIYDFSLLEIDNRKF